MSIQNEVLKLYNYLIIKYKFLFLIAKLSFFILFNCYFCTQITKKTMKSLLFKSLRLQKLNDYLGDNICYC